MTWWYHPVTDHYLYQADSPGAEWIATSPTIVLTSITPSTGT